MPEKGKSQGSVASRVEGSRKQTWGLSRRELSGHLGFPAKEDPWCNSDLAESYCGARAIARPGSGPTIQGP